MRSCSENAFGCEGVVCFCVTVRDLTLFGIREFLVWIAWMVGELAESMLDLVWLVIGSWSPLELIATCAFFGNCEYLLLYYTLGSYGHLVFLATLGSGCKVPYRRHGLRWYEW